jgi:hypothetical protein
MADPAPADRVDRTHPAGTCARPRHRRGSKQSRHRTPARLNQTRVRTGLPSLGGLPGHPARTQDRAHGLVTVARSAARYSASLDRLHTEDAKPRSRGSNGRSDRSARACPDRSSPAGRRSIWVQRREPPLVERMDHLADTSLGGRGGSSIFRRRTLAAAEASGLHRRNGAGLSPTRMAEETEREPALDTGAGPLRNRGGRSAGRRCERIGSDLRCAPTLLRLLCRHRSGGRSIALFVGLDHSSWDPSTLRDLMTVFLCPLAHGDGVLTVRIRPLTALRRLASPARPARRADKRCQSVPKLGGVGL